MSKSVGVFPATGGLGGSTLKYLLEFSDPNSVTAILRKPETVLPKAKESATVRSADYDVPASLEHAFDGLSTLNIISYPSFEGEARFLRHKTAIDAARKSGVSHIFYSSLAFGGNCTDDSVALVMEAHLKTERYLKEIAASDSSFTYTVVRIGLYSESFPIYTASFDLNAPTSEIRIPHNGTGPGIAWAKREELGEAMARLISKYQNSDHKFPFVNQTILLSGPRVWTLNETVALFSILLKIPIHIKEVSIEEYASQPQVKRDLTYNGVDMSKEWADAWDAIRLCETAVVTPLLAQLLGRQPEGFEKTIQHMVEQKNN
ncbi:quinone oxidoreductase [Acrasis kona]|uniref:Quinone oxidoreductase n=1 Tax=Acrasis kona TaxID=1008807 RepID=A0AAW2YSB5_9EUKA